MLIRKMNNMRLHYYIIAFLIGLSSNIYSQDSLSLTSAIELALANNFDIQIAEIQKDQATRNNTIGQAGGLPTVGFSLSERTLIRNNNSPTSFIRGSYSYGNVSPTLDVGWTLFNGFRVRMTKDKLASMQFQSEGNAHLVLENTIQAVILAYNACLLEKEKLGTYEQVVSVTRSNFELSQKKKQLGLLTSFEVLQEKNNYLADSSTLITQIFNYENAVRNLNLVLSTNVETEWYFTDKLSYNDVMLDIDVLKQSLESNTSLQTELLNIELRQADLGIARSQLYPSLSMNIGTTYSLDGTYRDSLLTGSSYDFYLNFTISWTLFNGGQIKRGIINAQDDIRIAELKTEDLKLTLTHSLVSQAQLYNIRKKLLGISQIRLETAELNFRLAEERYNAGLINSIDFRIIQNNYLNAKITVLSNKYNLIDTETEIQRLTGAIVSK